MKISYDTHHAFEGWHKAPQAVEALIRTYGVTEILEIGAGANPTLDRGAVERLGLNYTINDAQGGELEKAPEGYKQLVLDFATGELSPELRGRYQFVFSRMVNEHVRDGETYFRNICGLLSEGGISAHFFSTLYALPFLANKLMPEALSSRLLQHFRPRDAHKRGKFTAHYSWSRGPTSRSIRRLNSAGFEVVEYTGYFGHSYYRDRAPLLHAMQDWTARVLARMPIAHLTSYARLVLRKAPAGGIPG